MGHDDRLANVSTIAKSKAPRRLVYGIDYQGTLMNSKTMFDRLTKAGFLTCSLAEFRKVVDEPKAEQLKTGSGVLFSDDGDWRVPSAHRNTARLLKETSAGFYRK